MYTYLNILKNVENILRCEGLGLKSLSIRLLKCRCDSRKASVSAEKSYIINTEIIGAILVDFFLNQGVKTRYIACQKSVCNIDLSLGKLAVDYFLNLRRIVALIVVNGRVDFIIDCLLNRCSVFALRGLKHISKILNKLFGLHATYNLLDKRVSVFAGAIIKRRPYLRLDIFFMVRVCGRILPKVPCVFVNEFVVAVKCPEPIYFLVYDVVNCASINERTVGLYRKYFLPDSVVDSCLAVLGVPLVSYLGEHVFL